MLPGSLIGVFFVVCLVPGWTYYRATRSHRPPVEQSSLAESLELIATGVATTGAATFFAALTMPERVLALGRISTGPDLRDAALLGVCVIGAATGWRCSRRPSTHAAVPPPTANPFGRKSCPNESSTGRLCTSFGSS